MRLNKLPFAHAALAAGLGLSMGSVPKRALAQPAIPSPLHFDFENGVAEWVALGESCRAAPATEAGSYHGGLAGLRFDYEVGKGKGGALMLPVAPGALAATKSIQFWIKSSANSPLAMLLQEKEGGRYAAFFTTTAGNWQQVELAPTDFALLQGDDDPHDPNNQLDLDRAEFIGLTDMSQIFAGDEKARPFGVKDGPRSFYLDDFETSAAAPLAQPKVDGAEPLDDFSRPQVRWMGVGDLTVSVVENKTLTGRALQWEARSSPGALTAIVKFLPRRALARSEQIHFQAASQLPTQLILAVETVDGGKYHVPFELKGGLQVEDHTIYWTDLKPSEDSKSPLVTLDRNNAKQLTLADLSGLTVTAARSNNIWFGPMTLGH